MLGKEVSFHNISKRYGSSIALENFNLEVAAGEFMTFLGPSGSGKSTALNIMAGFTAASAGDVRIGGASVVDLPPERRNVGMVFQSYSLFPHMNVFDNVAFPLRIRKANRNEISQRVNQALEMVRLSDLAGRMPSELSGGQRQRVAFARAIIFEPPVLLMDEPLGALDLKLRQEMQLEIKQYHAQLGCTIIFVTHDQDEALALSDRIAVMGEGRIAQVDTPQNIYDRPNSRYVAEFIGRTNIISLSTESHDGAVVWGESLAGARSVVDANGFNPSSKISVRPEKIKRLREPEPDLVCADVTITEVMFMGDTVQYQAEFGHGGALIFEEHRSGEISIAKSGDRVMVGFKMSDVVQLED